MSALATDLIGYIAMACCLMAVSQTCDQKLRGLMALSLSLFSLHFVGLGGYAAAATVGCAATRIALASLLPKNNWVMTFFALLGMSLFSITYQTPTDIIPLVIYLIATYAYFALAHIPLRVGLIACSVLGIVNAIILNSPPLFITDAVLIGLNAMTIYRLKHLPKVA
ncbi:YgjV family protein [Neptuniibacter sp. QD37_11]|uniref:YgjV family protein n=1 Tax=Neptuniibacter sp. QD37_11 TaxID=3398209 RepID=UPI0039F4A608